MAATLPLPSVNGTNNGAAAPSLPSPAASSANGSSTAPTVGPSTTAAAAPPTLPLCVVSLAVTYVPLHADDTFRRFARGPAPSFLWYPSQPKHKYQHSFMLAKVMHNVKI
jgi:hypothetical protein